MTVLLVLFTFITFLLIDYFRTRHTVLQLASQVSTAKQAAVAPRLQPAMVGGFEVPENLRYHPGHTWALSESPSLVRVGMDDFASKLTGKLRAHHAPATRPVDSPGPEALHTLSRRRRGRHGFAHRGHCGGDQRSAGRRS